MSIRVVGASQVIAESRPQRIRPPPAPGCCLLSKVYSVLIHYVFCNANITSSMKRSLLSLSMLNISNSATMSISSIISTGSRLLLAVDVILSGSRQRWKLCSCTLGVYLPDFTPVRSETRLHVVLVTAVCFSVSCGVSYASCGAASCAVLTRRGTG